MKRLTLLFAGSFLLFASLACSGGGDSERISGDPTATVSERIASDPQAILELARSAIADLESYHAAFVFPAAAGDGERESRWEIEFAAPYSYRILVFLAGGEITCEASIAPDDLRRGQTCREVPTSATQATLAEAVYVGDTIYGRQCKEIDLECEPWEKQPRGQIVIAALSPTFFPQWPLLAMEMAGELELLGQDEVDGVALTHFRGSVNHIRAILENQRRVLTAAGISSFGTECHARLTPTVIDETGELVESAPGTPFDSEEACHELTFEESLESQEPGLSFYDENRTTIDIWVSLDDFLVHRVALSIPPDQPGDVAVSFVVEYSLFDQVQIEAPR